MTRDEMEIFAQSFMDAGMKLTRAVRWSRERWVVDTGTSEDKARVVWSLLDRDRCFVEERGGFGPERSYRTWYPTRYWHRFRSDDVRRIWPVFMSLFAIIPTIIVLLVALGRIGPVVGFSVGVLEASIMIAVLIGTVIALRRYFTGESSLDVESLSTRLGIGIVVGLIWSLSIGWPTPVQVVGAVWVFVTSNIVWIASVGADRLRFDEIVERVGGRLPRPDALRLLDSLTHANR